MIASRQALRQMGWAALLGVCCVLLFGLSLKVNALRSEVRRAEIRLVAIKRETLYLETEFETRANQQQLETWNDVDFGYVAPNAAQYLDNVDQLAALGRTAAPLAPPPVQMASNAPRVPASSLPAPSKVRAKTETPKQPPVDADADNDADPDKATPAPRAGERLAKLEVAPKGALRPEIRAAKLASKSGAEARP